MKFTDNLKKIDTNNNKGYDQTELTSFFDKPKNRTELRNDISARELFNLPDADKKFLITGAMQTLQTCLCKNFATEYKEKKPIPTAIICMLYSLQTGKKLQTSKNPPTAPFKKAFDAVAYCTYLQKHKLPIPLPTSLYHFDIRDYPTSFSQKKEIKKNTKPTAGTEKPQSKDKGREKVNSNLQTRIEIAEKYMKNILIDRELSDADITQLKKIPNLKLSISESGKITQAQLNILSSNITNLNIAFYTKNSINISKCTKLQYLECQGTKSTVSGDISNIKNLHSIVSTNNTKITGDISSMKQLQYIDVNNSGLFGTITPSTHSSLLNKDGSFIHTRNTYYNTKIVRKDSGENIIGTFAN